MNYPAIHARSLFLSVLVLLALIVLLEFLVGHISLKGLLTQKRGHGINHLSIGRAQLLIVTTAVAINFLKALVLNSAGSSIPDIPSFTIVILGASEFLYLLGKARAIWIDHTSRISRKG